MREVFVQYEQLISSYLYEGENYTFNSSSFNFTVLKYSRMLPTLPNITRTSPGLSLVYPLSTAVQPTPRQSLSLITFSVNPFLGSNFLDQAATSLSAAYFAYRDTDGNYLTAENVRDRI